MARSAVRGSDRRITIAAGPWKGVYDTTDPYDDRPDLLSDALNLYIPDPLRGGNILSRPGFTLANSASQLGQASSRKGQGMHTHIAADGTQYVFFACGGKIYRADQTLTTFTDVTPVGPTLAADADRVFFVSANDSIVVTDGENRPWVGTNLSSTPITGTNIQYNAANDTWSAYGEPVVYAGSVIFVLNEVAGVSARTDIALSEPGTPATGYQQTNYDNNWTVAQTEANPIFALLATNVALYYFREDSIGTITGTPGPDFETSATHDTVSFKVGCVSPATIVLFGEYIYFCDSLGRPYRLPLGGRPEPIWLQMRRQVESSSYGYPVVTARVSSAALDTTTGLIVFSVWSDSPELVKTPTEMFAFDARSGVYMGRWNIFGGVYIDVLGVVEDNNGRASLCAIGSKTVGGESGYIWYINTLSAPGSPTITEDDLTPIELEDSSYVLGTEGTELTWQDNGTSPSIQAITHRLGYSEDHLILADILSAVVGATNTVTISVETPNDSEESIGTPTPSAAADGAYRITVGLNTQGRGLRVSFAPNSILAQWALGRVSIKALKVPAGPDEI
jgi:hypothetical protein